MSLSTQKIMDSGIQTGQIAAGAIIPADIDETVSYNFSSIGSTWAGVFEEVRIQTWKIALTNSSTARGYPKGNFAATPILVAVIDASANSSCQLFVQATSASSYDVWHGVTTPGPANCIAVDMT